MKCEKREGMMCKWYILELTDRFTKAYKWTIIPGRTEIWNTSLSAQIDI